MRAKLIFLPSLALTGLMVLALGQPSVAGDKGKGKKAATMKVGDKAPMVEGIDDQGKPWKSADVVGKKVLVLFFFPAALTGG